MGYTPEQIRAIAAQLGGAYRRGEVEILNSVVNAQLTDWERARIIAQQQKIRDVLDELGEVEDDWSQMHLRPLYTEAVGDVAAATQTAPPAELSALHETSIQILGENLATALDEARATVGRRVDDLFRRAGLANLQRSTILGQTARDAMQNMVAQLQEQGITAFVDVRGARWNLSTYAEMVARTTSREATDLGLGNRMAELGEDLVQISRHGGECPKCVGAIETHGLIYSISGTSEEYPSVEEGRAAGLWHPQCVHVRRPYIERYAQQTARAGAA
ncbi:MAG TPA: phage minor capsid protein [Armatimonadota bacterium]|nr:phage minor capsid protein [Armatimonadota bacterium]